MASQPSGLPHPLSLPISLHFWSGRDELLIRETDFGVFRVKDKNDLKHISKGEVGSAAYYAQDKLSYATQRGISSVLDNKKNQKLKANLREFEGLLSEMNIVFSNWRSPKLYQIMFHTGLLANIWLTKLGDIEKITFDKVE